ncbi:PKD domain-containing protein, partial [Janthinobacterium sp. GB1R12]|uniref:PKD domain-containing protein n=1 Tax=Janthinobacterium sp. GB1R12 TaxID=3424190 RepID=UPI003F297F32
MKILATVLSSCMLVACGGGGGSSPVPVTPTSLTVNGTAATGKAIAGATITAKCQTGTGDATTLADGSYSLAAAGGKLPCLLQITDPADGSKLHTLVLGSGSAATANITPLTEMLTARVLGSEPTVFFAAFDATIANNKVTTTAVKAAQADVGTVLNGVVDTSPLVDFLATPLKAATQGNPAGGDAQDRLLDALRVKINAARLTQVVTALAKITNTDAIKQVIADIAAVPPVAQAGPLQSVVTGTVVTLDGSGSSAAAGRTLSYAWTLQSKPAASTASLSSPTSARPTFTVDVAGTYVASLVVNDGKVSSNAAAVSITASVANAAPVANAGYAQNVLSGSVVELDGSASSDANGDVLTFAWKLTEKPANSTATLSSVNSARPTFTADASGLYVAKLMVNDGKASSADATVTVSASAVDTSGPSVSAITVNPTTVDVSQASQLVTATVTVTDATGINLSALPNP